MTPMDWILGGDTGVSSKTIFAVMVGRRMDGALLPNVPFDADDFGRCYRLLKAFPEWRERLPEVAERHPEWSALVGAWAELEAMYEGFCAQDGGYRWSQFDNLAIEAMGRRIRSLVDEGRLAAGWERVGDCGWRGPTK